MLNDLLNHTPSYSGNDEDYQGKPNRNSIENFNEVQNAKSNRYFWTKIDPT